MTLWVQLYCDIVVYSWFMSQMVGVEGLLSSIAPRNHSKPLVRCLMQNRFKEISETYCQIQMAGHQLSPRLSVRMGVKTG